MLYLIRVYKDERVIFAATIDKDERLLKLTHPHTGCRCYKTYSWSDYAQSLAEEYELGKKLPDRLWAYEHGHIDMTPIYPSPRRN